MIVTHSVGVLGPLEYAYPVLVSVRWSDDHFPGGQSDFDAYVGAKAPCVAWEFF